MTIVNRTCAVLKCTVRNRLLQNFLHKAADLPKKSLYQHLFSMIYKSRADILPRSILEVSAEQEQYHHKLKVHPTISIYYPTALYYFVKKDNEELASWIETGLNRLIRSGEFERLFQEEFGDDIQRAKSAKLLVIKLTNPYLPANTPFNRPELWYFNQNIAKSD